MLQTIQIIENQPLANGYHQLLLAAPNLCSALSPGQGIQLQDSVTGHLSSVLPILKHYPQQQRFSVLGSAMDTIWADIVTLPVGTTLAAQVPVGPAWQINKPRLLLLGEQAYLGALLFVAAEYRTRHAVQLLVFLESDNGFAFAPRPSQMHLPDLPPEVIAAVPLLEDWDIPSRLAHPLGLPGCFEGSVLTLARQWVDALPAARRTDLLVIAAGRAAFLAEVEALSAEYDLACQVFRPSAFAPLHGANPTTHSAS